jgi:PKD repeat protein
MASAVYLPGTAGPTIGDETVALVREAMGDATRAITMASGLVGYELEAPAKVIVPVVTPLVNMLPRRRGNGADIVHWKAITSFDTSRNWGVLADGGTPSQVTYAVASLQNTMQTIGLMNAVTFQAQWRGRALEADVRARRIAELLYQLKMTEERWLLGASTYLMTPPAPIVATAATGGSIAAGTYWVKVTAKNTQGETTSSPATKIVTTGATSTLTITVFTVPNATQYNIYIGSGASQPADSALWLQAGISGANAQQPAIGATVTLADGATVMPSGEVNPAILPLTLSAPPATTGTALSTVAANTAKTFVDGSGTPLMWDGLIAQALNNTSLANGATLGAQVAQPADPTGKLALADIDNLLAGMYLQAAGDPDYIIMNPLDNVRLTNLVVGAGQLRYVVQAGDSADQGQLTAQYRVTRYLNKSTGREIPIILDRYCPQGYMVFLPVTVPFPVPEVSSAIEIETNQEYWGVDFAVTDSNFRFADYVDETVKVFFLGGLGVIRGIYPSF